MSEYQYYEFQAIERPLTREQMDELRRYSTRAQITATSFVNVYHWGSFKGDPDRWMEKYFDAFLYVANWGTRTLMFRVPAKLLPTNLAESYSARESFSCRTKGSNCILSFESQEEDYDVEEGEGWLSSLISLRADLLRGDLRGLYLGWLLGVQNGEPDDDTIEPPVPPNLGNLNAPLQSLADFLRIDPDLIATAAERSADRPTTTLSKEDIAICFSKIPSREKDDILARLVEGEEPNLAMEFRQRVLRELQPEPSSTNSPKEQRRRVAELLARSAAITEKRLKEEAERRAREEARRERERVEQRKKHLDSLVGREADLWQRVEQWIATKQPNRYDEAVSLLADLRDVAAERGESPEFTARMETLRQQHAQKLSLIKRLQTAGLCP